MLCWFLTNHRTNLLKSLNKKIYYSFSTSVKEHQITISGQRLNYVRTGNGSHTLLCFPGALGTIWSDFKPQIENLNKNKFTVVAWDPPGYGLSRPPNREFSTKFYENDADTAFKFMKELGVDKFSLLGWSDGGNSSIILAAKYPDTVNKLVVWGSNSYVAPEDLEVCERVSDISKWSDKMKAPLIAVYGEDGLQDIWTNWFNAIKTIYNECEGNICKEKLSLVQCPTFVLHGDKDPMLAREHPGYLSKNIQTAKLHRFPDGKHNIHLKYAKEFNELVSGFLEENCKSGP